MIRNQGIYWPAGIRRCFGEVQEIGIEGKPDLMQLGSKTILGDIDSCEGIGNAGGHSHAKVLALGHQSQCHPQPKRDAIRNDSALKVILAYTIPHVSI